MQKDQNVKVLYLTILQTKTETSILYLLLNKLYRLPNKCFNAYFGLRTEPRRLSVGYTRYLFDSKYSYLIFIR